MATKALFPTGIIVDVSVDAQVVRDPRALSQLTELRPFKMRVFDAPAYRMRHGHPTDVPAIDIRAHGLASASGERLQFRPGPRDVNTSATARWIAEQAMFDDIGDSWLPIRSDMGAVTWNSSNQFMPTLAEDYVYSIRKERFTMSAVNFDRDGQQHMWTSADALTGSAGFTVIMVCTMTSVYGNTDSAGYSGIFGSGQPTPASGTLVEAVTDKFEVRLAANTLRIVTNGQVSPAVSIGDLMGRSAPMYLAFALGRPSSVVYAGKGPASLQSAEVPSGTEDMRYYGELVLGRGFGDTLHSSDMALLDFGLYVDRLTPRQIRNEVAILSSVYGAEGG